MTRVPAAAGAGIERRRPFGANPLVGERGSDTQRRILAAGLAVFAEVGYNAARVELITQRAGCSRPAFYQYFSSKDDVFWKLAAQLGSEMMALGDRLGYVAPNEDGVAELTRWVEKFTNLHDEYAAVFSTFQEASRNHPTETKASNIVNVRLDAALLGAFGLSVRDKADAALATGAITVLIRCSSYWEALGGFPRIRLIDGLARMLHRLFVGSIEGVNVVPPPAGAGGLAADPVPPLPRVEHARDLRTRGEKTRRRLLDAGAAVLPRSGYHATRVDDIVHQAGVSHGSFYRYFANKDDFFRVMAEDASTRMIELLDRFPADVEPTALHEWLDEWFTTYQSNGGVISTWQETQLADPTLAAFSQEVAAAVVARLVRVLGRRGFGDAAVDALALLALVERMPYGVFTLRFIGQTDAIEAMTTIIRRGFMGL